MKELCVSTNPNYKLCMLLDDLAMITVDTPKYGVIEVCHLILLLVTRLLLVKARPPLCVFCNVPFLPPGFCC